MTAAQKLSFEGIEIPIDTGKLLQGNLQSMFDALYHLGIIDPVLEMDWEAALDQSHLYETQVLEAIHVANGCSGDSVELAEQLKSFDQRTVGFLAMEVAREFADYHSRQGLH